MGLSAREARAERVFLPVSFTSLGCTPTPQKRDRNKIYVVCGVIMLACIALIAVYHVFLEDTGISSIKPVFLLETLALWAFGFSWITKGEWLRKDPTG